MTDTKKRNAFHLEAATTDWGTPEWDLVDDHGVRWGTFSNRTAATACLRGYVAIGFVPRPNEPSIVHVATRVRE